jgi:hypothetical protein
MGQRTTFRRDEEADDGIRRRLMLNQQRQAVWYMVPRKRAKWQKEIHGEEQVPASVEGLPKKKQMSNDENGIVT